MIILRIVNKNSGNVIKKKQERYIALKTLIKLFSEDSRMGVWEKYK